MRLFCPLAVSSALSLAGALASAGPLFADTPLGGVRATLDGQDHRWQTLAHGDDASIGSHFADFGFVWQVQIAADGADDAPGDLLIVFSGLDGETVPNERQILFEDGETGRRFASAADDDDAVVVERLEIGDDHVFAEGWIGAELCRRDGLLGALDSSDCVIIEGRFETRLPIDE